MNAAFSLEGKTILITGASSGIGRQIALHCANTGAQLVLIGRNRERLSNVVKELKGNNHASFAGDLLGPDFIQLICTDVKNLDGVVHAAGIVKPFPISFIGKEQINETLHSNFYTAAELTAALFKARKINNNAAFVFMSSISGQHPHKGGALYAASKAALEAFSKTVALEYAHKGIRANCISPAMVKTPMFDVAAEGMSNEKMDEHIKRYPLGVGYPEDVANAAIFLLSQASRWITGINLVMDGGLLLHY